MTEDEAQVFLDAMANHDICISYLSHASGKPVFRNGAPGRGPGVPTAGPAPAPTPLIPARQLSPSRRRGGNGLSVAMVGALAACTPHGEPEILDMPESAEDAAPREHHFDPVTIPDAPPPEGPAPDALGDVPCDSESDQQQLRDPPVKGPRVKGRKPVRKKGKLMVEEDFPTLKLL